MIKKSIVAERFVRTFKNKIYKYMISVLKHVYIGKLDNIINKYNNSCHSTIKLKPVDVKSSTYIDFNKVNNEKDPKFEVGHHVRKIKIQKHFFKKLHSILVWRSFYD